MKNDKWKIVWMSNHALALWLWQYRSPLRFDVVAVEIFLFSEVQLTISDNRLRPGGEGTSRNFKPGFLFITFRVSFNQSYNASFAQAIKMTICIDKRALAYTS